MSTLGSTWRFLSPRARQWLTLGARVLVVATLALLVATAPDEGEQSEAERRLQVANLLTVVDPRDLGIDAPGRRMNALAGELRKLAYGLEQLGLDAADSEGASGERMPRSFILTNGVSARVR